MLVDDSASPQHAMMPRPLSVHDLPNEVTAKIFKALTCIPGEAHSLLEVSLTCKLWYIVIYGTPSLWAHLVLDQAYPARVLSLWIERSKPSPLDITMLCAASPDAHSVLLQNSDRWRALDVGGIDLDQVRVMLRPYNSGSFPRLEAVSIRSGSYPPSPQWSNLDAVFSFFTSTPHEHASIINADLRSIKTLKLTRICTGCIAKTFSSPSPRSRGLSALTHLRVTHFEPTWGFLDSLFAQSPLSTLVLDNFLFNDTGSGKQHTNSIDASSLKELAVRFDEGHARPTGGRTSCRCNCCLSWLSMPNLESLEIWVPGAHRFDHFAHFQDIYSHVRTFKLSGMTIDIGFCAKFPWVADLHLAYIHVPCPRYTPRHIADHTHHADLLQCSTLEVTWPNLRKLSTHTFHMGPNVLTEWVETRRSLGLPLDVLRVSDLPWMGLSQEERFALCALVKVEVIDRYDDWRLLF